MEHHKEFAGPQFEVLLGLLGQTIRDVQALNACETSLYEPWRAAFTRISFGRALGCPSPIQHDVPTSIEYFEGGMMIWVDLGAHGRKIYVIHPRSENTDVVGREPTYRLFDDTWNDQQPLDGGLTPPDGLREPQRGFGKIWREQPDVHTQLGWAVGPEQPFRTDYQTWQAGGAMMSTPDVDDVHHSFLYLRAFAPDGQIELVKR
jgi:hypothetical protein